MNDRVEPARFRSCPTQRMAPFADFLKRLLDDGEVVFHGPPLPRPDEQAEAAAVLRGVFAEYRLGVAGPPLDFRQDPALATAELVRQACWFLVHRGEPGTEVERRLTLAAPRTPA